MSAEEQERRLAYCKQHDVHHLFELLATKVLTERPENPFAYLRALLTSIEEGEKRRGSYDPTQIPFASDDAGGEAAAGESNGGGGGGGAAEAARPHGGPPNGVGAKKTGKESGKRRRLVLGTFGLNNAGKTSLLSALGGNVDQNCMPTVGFTPIQFSTEEFDICIFDLGGAANFRGIWVHYFHDCHGLIYVVDSAADAAGLAESATVFAQTAGHAYMRGKPVLVLANKKDLPESRVHESETLMDAAAAAAGGISIFPADVVAKALSPGTPVREVATCGIRADPALEAGVEWLLATVAEQYDVLAARVAADSAHVKAEKDRKRAERLAELRTGA